MAQYSDIFTDDTLAALFPASRADNFFEALFGEAEEGSYDIVLKYQGCVGDRLDFDLQLVERPGKCLACNLTYGLPQVFSRHPVINLPGLAGEIASAVGREHADWEVGQTREIEKSLHAISLSVELA
jgi:hypothetical protein